jgi:hypothetical protein
VEAFQGIFYGHLEGIINLIERYPMFKNRSGPFLTTLLYSAANNASVHIVKYLVEIAKCSINSQNRRTDSNDNFPSSTAGSTALHAAASIGHRDLVAYLVEHGADIYVLNQAGETPLTIGVLHDNIRQYFENCLISGYSKTISLTSLSVIPVANADHPQQDCFWEYMPIDFNTANTQLWYPFPLSESAKLQQALFYISRIDISLYFIFSTGLYSIDCSRFLLTQTFNYNSNALNMAWIRCRGSSLLNCNCCSMWQILLVKHCKCEDVEKMTSTLEFEDLPTISAKERNLRLNTWYFCDVKVNSLLDSAMKSRRKHICMDVPSIGEKLVLNLFDFVFSNASNTICGHIRWLPKPSVGTGTLS